MATRRFSQCVLLALLLTSAMAATAATQGGGGSNNRQLFNELKKLEGDWEATWEGRSYQPDKPAIPVNIRLIAGGSVVQETVGTGANDQMATLYHMDGNDLVITHFCNLGNQPQYRLSATTSKLAANMAAGDTDEASATTLSFSLVRVGNLSNTQLKALPSIDGKAAVAGGTAVQYMRLDWIKIINPDLVKTHWTILRNGKKFSERVTTLKRVKSA